jgi:hypothetical protein
VSIAGCKKKSPEVLSFVGSAKTLIDRSRLFVLLSFVLGMMVLLLSTLFLISSLIEQTTTQRLATEISAYDRTFDSVSLNRGMQSLVSGPGVCRIEANGLFPGIPQRRFGRDCDSLAQICIKKVEFTFGSNADNGAFRRSVLLEVNRCFGLWESLFICVASGIGLWLTLFFSQKRLIKHLEHGSSDVEKLAEFLSSEKGNLRKNRHCSKFKYRFQELQLTAEAITEFSRRVASSAEKRLHMEQSQEQPKPFPTTLESLFQW